MYQNSLNVYNVSTRFFFFGLALFILNQFLLITLKISFCLLYILCRHIYIYYVDIYTERETERALSLVKTYFAFIFKLSKISLIFYYIPSHCQQVGDGLGH